MSLPKLEDSLLSTKTSLCIFLFPFLHVVSASFIYAQAPSSLPLPDMVHTVQDPASEDQKAGVTKIIITGLLVKEETESEQKLFENPASTSAAPDRLFGYRGGNFHPYFSLRGEWTDNLYNLNIDERTSFLTFVSSGVWFGIPRTKKVTDRLSPYNTAVGGTRYSLPNSGSFDRFQAFLLGGFDYKNHSANSDLNYTVWNIEGLVQYNLPAGISFRIMDRFIKDRDQLDIGSFLPRDFTVKQDNTYATSTPSRIRKYTSNQAHAALNFNMSERFSAHLGYTNFYLNYDESVNEWLNRTDNRFSLSLAYKYRSKTSFFVEYSQAAINYEVDTGNNNENIFTYGGINWTGSVKTSLMAKGGYQIKKYENNNTDDLNTFTMEAQANYRVTDKTKMSFSLYKALEESNSLTSRGRDTIAAKFRYDQQFSYNFRGYCEFRYEYFDYKGFDRVAGSKFTGEARNDIHFIVKPAIQYYFKDWLMAELAYSFENNDSNENIYDFTTQTVFLDLNISF